MSHLIKQQWLKGVTLPRGGLLEQSAAGDSVKIALPPEQYVRSVKKEKLNIMNKTTIQSTPYGPVVIIWGVFDAGVKIVRVLLSNPVASALERVLELYPVAQESSCEEINSVASGICRLLDGEPIDFCLDITNIGICGEFQQRVLRVEHAIPRGRVSTYKLIAVHLGVSGGARAVGNALANNPFPLIVPCHRAIRSDHGLGGYQGGPDMKRSLLSKEGIVFDDGGRVQCSHFYYG
jgi:methylated-DNA-[protein]-cysteine S-methyltransferase